MSDQLKNLLITIAGVLLAIGAAITAYLGLTGSPQPQPSSTPSPIVSVMPSPQPSLTPSPQPSPSALPVMTLMVGMTEGFEFVSTLSGFVTPSIPNFTISFFEARDVETTIPTFKGARVGLYSDALYPVTSLVAGKKYWIDVTYNGGSSLGEYTIQIAGLNFNVRISNSQFSWPAPLYMEMQFSAVSQANGLQDIGETYNQRVDLNKRYATILRQHGVEPIKQGIYLYPDTTFTSGNFKDLVLTGNIAPPCLFGPAPSIAPSVTLLQSIEAAIKSGKLPQGTWVYAWDEGEGDTAATASALARVKLIKQYAPSLKVMVTRQYSAEFAPYVDVFTPVINWFNQPGFVPASAYANETVWLYHSCMSANRCNNATSASAVDQLPSKFAMSAIDAPLTDHERFVTESIASGAKGLLYYNTTESIGSAINVGGQYKFGNNGDGNLLYPQMGYSKRLKFYRRGLNKVALQKAGL